MENENNKINISLSDMTDEDKKTLFDLIKKYSNKKNKRWKPEYNELYYSIMRNGHINCYSWEDGAIDNDCFNLRNCFKTKEEAKFELERRKIIAELQDYADDHNDEMDWYDIDSKKWGIFCDYSNNKLGINDYYYSCHMSCIHFSSKSIAQAAIRAVGEDRIKKYIFGISEDKVN